MLPRLIVFLASIVVVAVILFGYFNRPSGARHILAFPQDFSLGTVRVIEDVNCFSCGNGEELVGEARGELQVVLPAPHWYIRLEMAAADRRHLDALEALGEAPIEAISFAATGLTDEGLASVSRLALRELDLSETAITGAGLKHLDARADWLTIILQSAKQLDPHSLDQLLGQNRVTVDLWRSNLDDPDFFCELQTRMCAALRPDTCHVKISGSGSCEPAADEAS